ncbi:MAG: hypothetical protein HY782_16965 [Chloroflexi bacterium]|nr:hypothetical protein [Chloroflexota bacterium]
MSIPVRVSQALAALFHIPPDALEYLLVSKHIGYPSETRLPFPAELIPIGARLVLRGWLNNKFFPTNRDWVLPYWAERQFDPRNPAFIPRGFNLYTINYAHRDWTMIGNLDRAREAIVDPRGAVTPWFDGWSLDVWLQVDGKLFAPSRLAQVEQSLYENLPIVVTEFQANDVRVRTEVFAAEEEDGGEWVVEQLGVENPSSAPRRCTLYVAVRPFNPEGVSLIKRLEIRESEGTILVNDAVGIVLPKPDGVAVSDFANGDVALALPALNGKTRVESKAGLATGVAAYHFDLAPGESKSWVVQMPMTKVERDEDDPTPLPHPHTPILQLRAHTIAAWRARLAQGMRVRLPDERLQNAFEANKAFLLLLHDGDSITPGPFTYHQFWFRDAAYLLNALDKLGYHAESREVIEAFPRRLEKDGYLRATEGEWDSNGAAIWAMVENARLTGDKELVARHYWSLLRMASWINSKRQQKEFGAHQGLLPPGPSAEHLGPSDYYYWDDFWGLAGLRDAAIVAEWVGQAKDAEKLQRNFESFRADVDASLAGAAARLGRAAMPASPYRRLDAGMVGNLAALYPLRLVAPDDPRIVDTLAALKETAWMEDAYFNHVGHSAFGTYLSLHAAQCYLFQRDPQAWKIVQWVLAHASPTFTWAEGIHPITRRGNMGDGHHGWALADFLLVVRNLLLYEENDHLVITPTLPEDWTLENNVIKVEDAPTYFGNVSYTIAFGERTGTLVVNADWRDAPEYVEWDLPFALREAGTDVESAEIIGNQVRLPRGVRRVVVTW